MIGPTVVPSILDLINRGRRAAGIVANQYAPKAAGPIGLQGTRGSSFPGGGRSINTGGTQPIIFDRPGPQMGSQQGARPDDLGLLYETLLNMLTSDGSRIGASFLPTDMSGEINPIYDAQLRAAEQRVGRGREEVESMYDALGADYERLAPEQAAQADKAQAEVQQLYNQLATDIEGNYARIAGEQEDLFKTLGIEEAAEPVLGQQNQQAAAAVSRANELGAVNEQRYMDIGNIDESYYREGAPLARLTGSNISKDLLFELENYAQELNAERAAALAQANQEARMFNAQASNQAAGASQQREQWQAGMLFDILQGMQQQPQEINSASFMASLPPAIQQQVAGAFRQIEKSPEAVYGAVEDPRHPVPGTFRSTPDEWYLNEVDRMYEEGMISEATRQALMTFLRLRQSE